MPHDVDDSTLGRLGGREAPIGAFFALLFLAFSDSPDSNKAAQRLVTPGFIWVAAVLVVGASLMMAHRSWWTCAIAYLLAASPPFFMFIGANVLMMGRRKG